MSANMDNLKISAPFRAIHLVMLISYTRLTRSSGLSFKSVGAIAAALLLSGPAISKIMAQNADLLIVNGKIVDGTGNPWRYGSVAIKNDKIVAVGNLAGWKAKKTLDARGLMICPGFIDVHVHIEGDEAKDPMAANFVHDGVTTVVTGNCGSSKTNIAEYLDKLDKLKMSINVATFIGHNDVRKAVMGRANRDPDSAEQARMERLVEKGMKDGAVGLSTGLIYVPGTYSKTNEIVGLAKAMGRQGGIYASHIRNESDSVEQAIEEAISIARDANVPLEISHFKVGGKLNWGKSVRTLKLVEAARAAGLDVTIDQYPYTASSTNLGTILPDWMLADGEDSLRHRLSDSVLRYKARSEMLARLRKKGLAHYDYAVVAYFNADTTCNGLSIRQVNAKMGKADTATEEASTILEMMSKGGAGMVFHGMDEADVRRIMAFPFNMVASDGGIKVEGDGIPHPRSFGTNARVLGKYAREENVVTMEAAVHRMTGLPAARLGLEKRGLLLAGFFADLVVFDAETIADRATYQHPFQYPEGIGTVVVNGMVTLEAGKHTGARNGRALRKQPVKK